MTVFNMNCIDGMKMFPDNTFDSIVTDPPYELGFMGNKWDSSGIANNVDMWREALRVLKPGGHLLAFSGSRTYHRMTCAIEDAGFEIRDQIMWVYGSGFPKSLDVSKAIDKRAGVDRRVTGSAFRAATGRTDGYGFGENYQQTEATSDDAKKWEGWGTALKPAHEPICVARKPFSGTVVDNVLKFGTGAINIDGSRVACPDGKTPGGRGGSSGAVGWAPSKGFDIDDAKGRWPANFIHDGSPEVIVKFLDRVAGGSRSGLEPSEKTKGIYGKFKSGNAFAARNDTGSAARFFYCAKASRADRNEGLAGFTPATTSDGRAVAADNAYQRGKTERANIHPTVKPTDLMRYLCRLVTPPGGSILDPFTGSGSTGKAAILENFVFIGFELSAEYTDIANARIKGAL